MKILWLGPDNPLIKWLRDQGDDVRVTTDPITPDDVRPVDWVVSYGYRHIIGKDIMKANRNIINCHIGYLPYNRGADPNLWSWIDDTPRGVTIHYVDEGLDTGPILAQGLVKLWEDETLATSYDKLHTILQELFRAYWHNIVAGDIVPRVQRGKGSYHRLADRPPLPQGWDTPVCQLIKSNT